MNLIFFIKRLLGIEGRKAEPSRQVVVIYPNQTTSCPELSYPRATQSRKIKTQGKYPLLFPEGAVVHYTASSDDPKNVINSLRKHSYVNFVIDRLGHVWQDFPLDEWGYHAGKSSWRDITGTVHNRMVGIEVICAGKVDKIGDRYRSWFGSWYDANEVNEITEGPLKGHYHKFTPVQEQELTSLITWLHANGKGIFKIDYVAGHHEVSPGRKTDPGGSLSMNMESYRQYLKKNIEG